MPKQKKIEKKYIQQYAKCWETDPKLKDWLAPDSTDSCSAFCKYCHTSLKAHKKDLINHANTEKHKKAVNLSHLAKSCRPLNETFKPVIADKTKISELKIAAFIAEHCSIQTADHLLSILKELDPSSEILSNLKLHRTKCSMIIKNVLGPCMLRELIEEIQNSPYSIIIDESTDLTTEKILCIMLRFFSRKKKEIMSTFYRLIKIVDCDAKSIQKAIKDQLNEDNLDLQNMVGIGVDGANVMVGKNNSVTTLFKKELDDLIIMKCICHSLHLCAEKATETLPRQLEFLIRETHNWFSYSPKRLDKYKELYKVINDNCDPKKIQGFSGTRWLARYSAIETILEQWDELKLLFSLAMSKDKCYMAEKLHDIMKILPFKAFLIFLKSELKGITQLNQLFQSDNCEPTKLLEDLFLMFKHLLQKLVVPSALQKLNESDLIDFDFESHLMHTSAMYFGYDFQCVANQIDSTELLDVKERCKVFLCTLTKEIQRRLPENISVLKMMSDLHPKIALSPNKPNLSNILSRFHRTHLYGDKNDVEIEWQRLGNKTWTNINNSVEFYAEVFEDQDAAGNPRFENIGKFAIALLTIPFSNAGVERAFSIYNVIKNKLRNKLSLEMLQSILMIRFTLLRNYGSCVKFNPSAEMIKLCNVNMYDFKKTTNNTDVQDGLVLEEILNGFID